MKPKEERHTSGPRTPALLLEQNPQNCWAPSVLSKHSNYCQFLHPHMHLHAFIHTHIDIYIFRPIGTHTHKYIYIYISIYTVNCACLVVCLLLYLLVPRRPRLHNGVLEGFPKSVQIGLHESSACRDSRNERHQIIYMSVYMFVCIFIYIYMDVERK